MSALSIGSEIHNQPITTGAWKMFCICNFVFVLVWQARAVSGQKKLKKNWAVLAETSTLPRGYVCETAHKHDMDPLIKPDSTAALLTRASSVYLNKGSKEMQCVYMLCCAV